MKHLLAAALMVGLLWAGLGSGSTTPQQWGEYPRPTRITEDMGIWHCVHNDKVCGEFLSHVDRWEGRE